LEKQYNNDRSHLNEYVDYERMRNVEKARLMAHAAVEEKINRRINIIFITAITLSILITLGVLLLLAAGVHYIWG
jgi:1,4-dihydroxy-2-naphthoate octaprenyltransferase